MYLLAIVHGSGRVGNYTKDTKGLNICTVISGQN